MSTTNPPEQHSNAEKQEPTMPIPRHLLTSLFTSLTHRPNPWTLLRTLKSDNPMDIQGDLHGTASFSPLKPLITTASSSPDTNTNANAAPAATATDILYHEEGDMPPTLGVGLRWTKKYIWRLSDDRIRVWFVKVGAAENEADYLFHEFEFEDCDRGEGKKEEEGDGEGEGEGEVFVTPPVPPPSPSASKATTVLAARGNHLCINDMYRTAYAFRVDEESGEVVSWASRHVVKGPKKNQDIVNLYW